jgi:cGMP-dependent protein kinase
VGDGFGEMALLYESPRSATIKAVEETYLWAIDRNSFRKTVKELMKKEQE